MREVNEESKMQNNICSELSENDNDLKLTSDKSTQSEIIENEIVEHVERPSTYDSSSFNTSICKVDTLPNFVLENSMSLQKYQSSPVLRRSDRCHSLNSFHNLSVEPILEEVGPILEEIGPILEEIEPFVETLYAPEISYGHTFWDLAVESTQTYNPDTVDKSSQTVDSSTATSDYTPTACSYCDSIPDNIF